jgi:hypothetical protein
LNLSKKLENIKRDFEGIIDYVIEEIESLENKLEDKENEIELLELRISELEQ